MNLDNTIVFYLPGLSYILYAFPTTSIELETLYPALTILLLLPLKSYYVGLINLLIRLSIISQKEYRSTRFRI